MVGSTYSHKLKTLEEYYEAIDNNRIAVFRGLRLTHDDEIRRDVITSLICNFELIVDTIEKRWQISFSDYFADELQALSVMIDDELVSYESDRIEVLPKGRFLIRNICMVFDIYMKQQQKNSFSKVI